MIDAKITKEYDSFFERFGKNFSHLTNEKKNSLLEFGFDNFIKNLEDRFGDKFDEELNMNDIYFYGIMNDNEFRIQIEKEKFIDIFGRKFSRGKQELQDELLKFGFDNFMKKINERELSLDDNLHRLFYLTKLNEDEFEHEMEYEKFKEYFGQKFTNNEEEFIEELISYGFEKFINDCKIKGIDADNLRLSESFYLVNRDSEDEKYDEEYRKFFNKFDLRFSTCKRHNKDELIKIGFEEFIRRCEEKDIDVEKINLSYILELLELNDEELRYRKEYELFRERFHRKFTENTQNTIDRLVSVGFDNFMKIVEEKNLDLNKRLVFLLKFIDGGENYEDHVEYEKFYKRFGSSFSLMRKEDMNSLIEFGFDNFMEKYNERELSQYDNYLSYDFYLIGLNDEEFNREIETNKFKNLLGRTFNQLNEEKREELYKVGFDEFMKRINERLGGYDKNDKFEQYYIYGTMNEDEYRDYRDRRNFRLKYGFRFSSLNQDVIEELVEYGFDKFEKDVKERGIDQNLRFQEKLAILKKNDSELKKDKELKKFQDEFTERRVSWAKPQILEKMLNMGFDEFMRIIEEREIETEGLSLNIIAYNVFLDEEQFNYELQEERFVGLFGKNFSSLDKEKKNEMIKIGFDEFIKRINERNIKYESMTQIIYIIW